MSDQPSREAAGQVSSQVVDWLRDLTRLLQCIERVVEQSRPNDDAPIEVTTLMPLLLPLIRQCRSQVPSEEMIEVWVREVQQKRQSIPPASPDDDPPQVDRSSLGVAAGVDEN